MRTSCRFQSEYPTNLRRNAMECHSMQTADPPHKLRLQFKMMLKWTKKLQCSVPCAVPITSWNIKYTVSKYSRRLNQETQEALLRNFATKLAHCWGHHWNLDWACQALPRCYDWWPNVHDNPLLSHRTNAKPTDQPWFSSPVSTLFAMILNFPSGCQCELNLTTNSLSFSSEFWLWATAESLHPFPFP